MSGAERNTANAPPCLKGRFSCILVGFLRLLGISGTADNVPAG